MSFLDNLGDAVHSVGKVAKAGWNVLTPVAAVSGLVVDLATAPWNDKADYNGFLNTLESRGMARLGQALKPIDYLAAGHGDDIVREVGSGSRYAYSNFITPTVGAVLGASGTGADAHKGAFLNPQNWIESFQKGKDVSPGQIAYAGIAGGVGSAARGVGAGGILPGSGVTSADFNLDDPEDRAVFHHGLGRLASGAVDLAVAWNLDPLVLAGRAASVVRRAKVIQPITAGTDIEAKLNTGRINGLIDELMNRPTVAQREEWLARNPSLSGPRASDDASAIVHLLARAENPTEAKNLLRLMMNPNRRNAAVLGHDAERLLVQANYLRDVRLPGIQRALDRNSLRSDQAALAERPGMLAQIDDLNANIATMRETAHYNQMLERAHSSLRNVPRIAAPQRVGNRFESMTGATWGVYQPSRLNVGVRVLKSATTMRAGVIDRNRPGEGLLQLQRMFDRTGHAFEARPLTRDPGGRFGLVRTPGAGISAEERGRHYAAWNAASTETEQTTAILAAEHAVVAHYAERLGIDAKVAEEIVNVAQHRRGTAQTYFRPKTAYTGARDTEGRLIDRLADDGVGEGGHALLETQLTNHFPLLDVDQINRIMVTHRATLQAQSGTILDGLRGMKGAAMADGSDAMKQIGVLGKANPVVRKMSAAREFGVAGGDEILGIFNQLWKPAQLMRLGWTIRVITDEQLRQIAILGAMSHFANVAHSLSHPNALQAAEVKASREELERMEAEILDRAALPDSVVREPNGNLQRVYHGTNATFEHFDDRAHMGFGWFGQGHYFTVDPAYASTYAKAGRGGNVRMHYLDLKKVWDYEMDTLSRNQAARLVHSVGRDPRVVLAGKDPSELTLANLDEWMNVGGKGGGSQKAFNREMRSMLEASGHDGVTHLERVPGPTADESVRYTQFAEGRRSYIAFSADSIHSPHLPNGAPTAAEAADIAALRKATKGRRKNRAAKFSEDQVSYDSLGRPVIHEGAFGGADGAVMADLSSSAGALSREARAAGAFAEISDLNGRYLNVVRARAGQPTTIMPTTDAITATEREAHAKLYAQSWQRAVNDQIGQSAIGRRILQGWTDEQVVMWLRHSTEGRALRERIPTRGHNPWQWAQEVRQHVDHYLPSESLRRLALEGRARISHLETAVPNVALRPEIHGESLGESLGTGVIATQWAKMVKSTYRRLGSTPTNVLSRHPHFAALYKNEMQKLVSAYQVAEHEAIPVREVQRMQKVARERALTGVRSTLYELSNASNLSHTFRYVTPFYSAWQEALTRWGGLFLEDPSRLAHMTQMWEAPSKMGLVKTDPDTGQQFIIVNAPGWMDKFLPDQIETMAVPKYWMRDLVAQGTYWMTPGFGAPVALPVAHMVRDRPDLYQDVTSILPYGPGRNAWDVVLPAAAKRAVSLWRKEDDATYAQTEVRIAQDLDTDRRLGKNNYTPEQLRAEVRKRTDNFFKLRVLVNLTLPFSPAFKSPYSKGGVTDPHGQVSPVDGYIEAAKRYRDSYSKMPGGQDPNGKRWEEKYLEDFGPDYFAFTGSASKSYTGIAPTVEGFQAGREFSDLLAQSPQFGSFIVGSDAQAGEFSSVAYNAQFDNETSPGSGVKDRARLSPQQALEKTQVAQGWIEYQKAALAIKQMMVARGAKSLNGEGVRDLAVLKRAAVARISRDFPAWAIEHNSITLDKTAEFIGFLGQHIDDARWADRPGMGTLKTYLSGRKVISSLLNARYAAGGDSTLGSKNNADLAVMWELAVERWKEQDVAFSLIHARWLERDLGLEPDHQQEEVLSA